MEVLLRLVRFLWLSNCPQKHNLLWEKGENLIAIEDTQSQWREEKGGKILDQKIFHKGWPRVGLFVVKEVFAMVKVPYSSPSELHLCCIRGSENTIKSIGGSAIKSIHVHLYIFWELENNLDLAFSELVAIQMMRTSFLCCSIIQKPA